MTKIKRKLYAKESKLKKTPSNFELNSNYTHMLYILGKSRVPLSSRQLEKCMPKISTHIYTMIENLTPTKHSVDKYLFTLEELLQSKENSNYKHDLIKKFNRIFRLDWEIGDKRDKGFVNDLIRFQEDNNEQSSIIIYIIYDRKDAVAIRLYKIKSVDSRDENNYGDEAIMVILKDEKVIKPTYSLIVKKTKENKLKLYTGVVQTIRYLDITMKEKVEQIISDKKKELYDIILDKRKKAGYYSEPIVTDALVYDTFPEIKETKTIRRNWRYSLNFRGFLLYLVCEVFFPLDKKDIDKKKSNERIRKVISNPELIKKVSFLLYSEYFEKAGLDVIGLLKKISEELFDQLHITAEEDNYLLRRATERYSVEVENYFYKHFELASSYPYIQKIGSEEYKVISEKINDYRQIIVNLRESWIVEQQKDISFLKRKSNYNKFTREFADTIAAAANSNAIISVDELAEKYRLSNIEVLNMLSLTKPNAYIIAGLHLIPNSKIPILHDNTRFEDALSLLKNNGIPDSCHFSLISELGFDVTGKKRWNDYSGAIIVRRKEERRQAEFS